ncbi:hypothetical protein Scep_013885 [Stephania cephalantha]|uniref:RING-type domain-containing protein n=1 Tax=Stephania cephalantha TaxID=152367 RepID=A0AAP0J0A6_9MAGN
MDEFATGFASLSLQDQVLLDFGGDARKGVTVAAAASSSSSSSSTSSSLSSTSSSLSSTSSSLSSTSSPLSSTSSSSCCAICLEKIELQEIALVKGCEHAYCFPISVILLEVRPLLSDPCLCDRIQDYLLEESVCLLLKANWFEPLTTIVAREEVTDEHEEYYLYEEDDDGMDDFYLGGSSSLRIGNPRWGSNGYVRTGRREARLLSNEGFQQDLGSVLPY